MCPFQAIIKEYISSKIKDLNLFAGKKGDSQNKLCT